MLVPDAMSHSTSQGKFKYESSPIKEQAMSLSERDFSLSVGVRVCGCIDAGAFTPLLLAFI